MLEAKDQGHNEQVLSEKKRSSRRKLQIFQEISDEEKKRSYSWPIFNKSKNSALLGRGQGIFLGLVGFLAKVKDFKMCLRGQGRPRELLLC